MLQWVQSITLTQKITNCTTENDYNKDFGWTNEWSAASPYEDEMYCFIIEIPLLMFIVMMCFDGNYTLHFISYIHFTVCNFLDWWSDTPQESKEGCITSAVSALFSNFCANCYTGPSGTEEAVPMLFLFCFIAPSVTIHLNRIPLPCCQLWHGHWHWYWSLNLASRHDIKKTLENVSYFGLQSEVPKSQKQTFSRVQLLCHVRSGHK